MEMIYQSLEEIILGLILFSVIFIPFERVSALNPSQGIFRYGFWTDATHFAVNRFFINSGIFALKFYLAILLKGMISPDLQASVAAQPYWLQFLEAIVIADFFGYWAHRFVHWNKLMWRFHAIHHSAPEMDWLVTFRVHPIDQVFQRCWIFIPIFILGFPAEIFGTYYVFFVFVSILAHTNSHITLGPLKWVIISPEFHHWHHHYGPEHIDKNFAALLPLFDLLFGTLYLPQNSRPPKFGIPQPVPDHYLKQLILPFKL